METNIKKQHVWARFASLGLDDTFFTQRGDRAIKTSFFGYRLFARPACFVNDYGLQSKFNFIIPWRLVKTTVLMRERNIPQHIAVMPPVEIRSDSSSWGQSA